VTSPSETTGTGAVYSPAGRFAASGLFAFSRVCVPLLIAVVWFANDPPVTPPVLLLLFAIFIALPALTLWTWQRAAASTWCVGRDRIVLDERRRVVEIPTSAIAEVRPWRIPLPAPGLTLHTRSGRRFAVEDPRAELLDALRSADLPASRPVGETTLAVYARARRVAPRRRWYHRLGKFPAFALLPTAPLFNVHQFIAYGGPLGEYYLLGARAYATTFASYWSGVTIYLILFASIGRAFAEAAALGSAYFDPDSAATARARAERAATIFYYAGVPVILAVRFLP